MNNQSQCRFLLELEFLSRITWFSVIKQLSSVELASDKICLLGELKWSFSLQRSKHDLVQDCFDYHNSIRYFKRDYLVIKYLITYLYFVSYPDDLQKEMFGRMMSFSYFIR